MKPIQPVKVFIPVDVNEEIPNGTTKNYPMISEHHWLKEQSSYVLSKEEMMILLGDAWEAAEKYANGKLNNFELPLSIQTKKEYLKTILP